jgi:hypothetical protein
MSEPLASKVSPMEIKTAFLVCYGVWLVAALAFVLPLKMALLRKRGSLTNDQLIALAKAGDADAQRLRRRTWWFFGISVALLLPLSILSSLAGETSR